jgi:hypothetical protein
MRCSGRSTARMELRRLSRCSPDNSTIGRTPDGCNGLMRKLSEIIKEMACAVLKEPAAVPSSEAAHAALLMAHVAWNRPNGLAAGHTAYADMLRQFERSKPSFWSELNSSETEALIAQLVAYKEHHHRHDRRQVVVCGMRGGNVHVEWVDPTNTHIEEGTALAAHDARPGPSRGGNEPANNQMQRTAHGKSERRR